MKGLLISIGVLAALFVANGLFTGSLVPGTMGTPACCMRRRASVLSPMARIAAADGPTNSRPAATTASANGARSDRKPYPGCTAWHPVSLAAATSFAVSR